MKFQHANVHTHTYIYIHVYIYTCLACISRTDTKHTGICVNIYICIYIYMCVLVVAIDFDALATGKWCEYIYMYIYVCLAYYHIWWNDIKTRWHAHQAWLRSHHNTDKQRVLMHGHQGWNVRHGLCHIYMRYVYIYELFIAFVSFVVCSLL